jgi:hypothetical protein
MIREEVDGGVHERAMDPLELAMAVIWGRFIFGEWKP